MPKQCRTSIDQKAYIRNDQYSSATGTRLATVGPLSFGFSASTTVEEHDNIVQPEQVVGKAGKGRLKRKERASNQGMAFECKIL